MAFALLGDDGFWGQVGQAVTAYHLPQAGNYTPAPRDVTPWSQHDGHPNAVPESSR